MEKIFEQILEKNYPAGLHKKIMRRVWFLKYQKIFFAGAAAAVIYAAISAFMLYDEMMEINFFDIIKTVFANIGFNLELLADAVRTSIALAPTGYVLNGLASFISVIFMAHIFQKNYIIKSRSNI